jgi:hypothetical protein
MNYEAPRHAISPFFFCFVCPTLTVYVFLLPDVGSEVLSAVVMKTSIFYDLTPCSPLQEHVASIIRVGDYLHHASFLLGSFFHPEDGGDKFLRNVGRLSTDYMVLHP